MDSLFGECVLPGCENPALPGEACTDCTRPFPGWGPMVRPVGAAPTGYQKLTDEQQAREHRRMERAREEARRLRERGN